MSIRPCAVALMLMLCNCGGSHSTNSARAANSEQTGNLKSLVDEDNEKEDKDVIARSQCIGENHKPKECLGDEDCCPGFYCGKDPEGSSRIRVCIDGG